VRAAEEMSECVHILTLDDHECSRLTQLFNIY
jgi:hypothetical protein